MQAQQLFELLRQYASLSTTSICMLHSAQPRTPCPKSVYFCGKESEAPAISFDVVKEEFCKRNKIDQTWPSVDAVLHKDTVFLFVEIKGWQNFDYFQIKNTDSEDEIKLKADNQAKRFNLKQKIEKSIEICKSISNDPVLFESIPSLYVLVTDVATIEDPLLRFRTRLGVLSYKSVNISLFNNASKTAMKALGPNVRYINCRAFDSFINSI